MADVDVRGGSTARLGRIEGDLNAGRDATIKAESGGKVVVTGAASFDGPVTIDCDFECQSMRVEGRGYGPGGNVTVRGNLSVHGRADINASTRVDGEVEADDLDVGGHFESRSLTARRARMGGHVKVHGALKAESVDAGGHLSVQGEVDLVNLRVGGHADIEGGRITGEIRARGHFSASKPLNFGEAEVFGKMKLPAGSTGRRLSAIGTVEFAGDASCSELDVGGTARVGGDCTGETVDVRGKMDVSGSLKVAKRLRVFGTVDAGRTVECETLGVLGRLVAERVYASGHADIAGEVKTSTGLKAQSILVGRGSKVTGPLVGGEVEVGRETDFGSMWGLPWWRAATGRMTTVEDVHGQTVHIGPYSSAERVFGEVVELKEGSTVYQVTYTKDLRTSGKPRLHDPPVKSDRLPEPPL